MMFILSAILPCFLTTITFAFSPPATLLRSHSSSKGPHLTRHSITSINRNNQQDESNGEDGEDFFDPFAQSPLSFGSDDDTSREDSANGSLVSGGSTFGFPLDNNVDIDTVDNNPESSSSSSDASTDDANLDFDPLLSPHAYANGIDAGPIADDGSEKRQNTQLGILLIDHGSRRKASNDHIHNVAKMYQDRLNENEGTIAASSGGSSTIVKAAHMEISEPSILDSLREIAAIESVSKVVCVPYFLSPGRHATEDVPNLIDEAKEVLVNEGLEVEVLVSGVIGSHLEKMLGAVDDLVGWTIEER